MNRNFSKIVANKLLDRNVYFLWSGGDDSNLLLRHFIYERIFLQCNFIIITIPFPQHVYSEKLIKECVNYLESKKINIKVLQTDTTIPNEISYADACSVCKKVRRLRFLEYYMPLKSKDDLIITGHNLSDLMSYYIELCIKKMDITTKGTEYNRFLEVTNKFLKSYKCENDAEIYRPLLDFSQDDIENLLSSSFSKSCPIDIVTQKCFWINQRKRLLQEYFNKANIKSDFDTVFNLLKKSFKMPTIDEFRSLPFDTYLV